MLEIKMNKFKVDYTNLENAVLKKAHKYEEVKDQLVKVAFDVYKFKSDEKAKLWQMHSADDGNYIVALYDSDDDLIEKKSDWQVIVNKSANNVNFFYQDEYVTKLPLDSFSMNSKDLETILPTKLAQNKNLVNLLLKNVNSKVKQSLLTKFPSLA